MGSFILNPVRYFPPIFGVKPSFGASPIGSEHHSAEIKIQVVWKSNGENFLKVHKPFGVHRQYLITNSVLIDSGLS